MKLLVKTTGSFMFVDPNNGAEVSPTRASVVSNTGFIQERVARGELKVLCNTLRDESTDKEFQHFYDESSGDTQLAIDSFIAAYGQEPEVDVEREKAKEELAKAAAEAKAKAEAEEAAKKAAADSANKLDKKA